MKAWGWCVLCSLWLCSGSAWADVQRFAVIVGNNIGQSPDVQLRYAESDAARVAQVLKDLGGFRPADVVVMQGDSADAVRATLISVNDRIRAAQALPNTEALLFVYYSGHADASALRLAASRLEFIQLAQLVRGSPARFRLLVVDACRSGTLTRVKGGSAAAPFALAGSSLGGEGMAFLTASSANEDAQETDELKGSFFTHAFVSGLLGAADKNGNGEVALEEAYAHAYDATLRATSRTWAGTQHPTFQYEVKGQGQLVLTRPGAAQASRARLVFPKGMTFLVMANQQDGAVLGEVGARDPARTLSLRPGRYFVRGRGPDHLVEGTFDVAKGQVREVDPDQMTRVAYARLVRKGERATPFAHALEVGADFRTPLPNATTPCWGGHIGYRLDLESLGFVARLAGCTSTFDNTTLSARTNEASLSLGVDHTWDFSWLSLWAGLGVGSALTHQSFESHSVAPSRLSFSPVGYLSLGAAKSFGRYYLALDLRGEGYLMQFQETALTASELRAEGALRTSLAFGMQF